MFSLNSTSAAGEYTNTTTNNSNDQGFSSNKKTSLMLDLLDMSGNIGYPNDQGPADFEEMCLRSQMDPEWTNKDEDKSKAGRCSNCKNWVSKVFQVW
jgi:hypothetical protein